MYIIIDTFRLSNEALPVLHFEQQINKQNCLRTIQVTTVTTVVPLTASQPLYEFSTLQAGTQQK